MTNNTPVRTRCDGNIANIKGTMEALATDARREMHNVSVNRTWICLTDSTFCR